MMDAGMRSLADFAGDWQMARSVDDRRGPPARFTGTARFRPDAQGLRVTEEGVMSVDNTQYSASRVFLWRARDDGIVVLFSDGRPFHQFRPAGLVAAAHWCDPDQYDVTYDFTRWPVWTSEWRVRGPRKDYVMRSTYRR